MTDIIIGGLVFLAIILAVRKIIKDRKNGSSCGSCSGCSQKGSCQSYHDLDPNQQVDKSKLE